jgi:hypothetical protein
MCLKPIRTSVTAKRSPERGLADRRASRRPQAHSSVFDDSLQFCQETGVERKLVDIGQPQIGSLDEFIDGPANRSLGHVERCAESGEVRESEVASDTITDRQRHRVIAVQVRAGDVVGGRHPPFAGGILPDRKVLGVSISVACQISKGELADELAAGDDGRVA